MKAFSCIALLAFAVPLPALAADATQVNCVIQTMPKSTQGEITAWATKLMAGTAPKPVSEKGEASIVAAGTACQAKLGWSDKARAAAIDYARFELGRQSAEQYLTDQELSPAAIHNAAMGLPVGDRRAIIGDRDKATKALMNALRERGLPAEDKNIMRMAVTAGAMVLMVDTMQAVFAAS